MNWCRISSIHSMLTMLLKNGVLQLWRWKNSALASPPSLSGLALLTSGGLGHSEWGDNQFPSIFATLQPGTSWFPNRILSSVLTNFRQTQFQYPFAEIRDLHRLRCSKSLFFRYFSIDFQQLPFIFSQHSFNSSTRWIRWFTEATMIDISW